MRFELSDCSVCFNCLRTMAETQSYESSSAALQLHEIGDRAKELVQEFLEVHKLDLPVVCRRPRARWHPPPLGCYKANVDVALFEGLDCMGIRVVFRDHEGCIIAALSQRVRLPQSIVLEILEDLYCIS